MVWGEAPKDVIRGEEWSAGHIPIILLGAVLVVFCVALPSPLQQLLEMASTLLLSR
jgi:hydrogenase-4 component F